MGNNSFSSSIPHGFAAMQNLSVLELSKQPQLQPDLKADS
jgi:hypothetical protein